MNIAVLGGGAEGLAIKDYFLSKDTPKVHDAQNNHTHNTQNSQNDHAQNVQNSQPPHNIQIFSDFTDETLPSFHLETFNLVFRSPSVHPLYILKDQGIPLDLPAGTLTSSTRYFFDHCPAPIIGVTGTKGKGTTSSLIKAILDSVIQEKQISSSHPNQATSTVPTSRATSTSQAVPASQASPTTPRKTHLLGNIGLPAISELDKISKDDIVIFEMSSFQLWDLEKSPHIAVVLRIEPDHLDRHPSFEDYVAAKTNIARHQTPSDFCIYYAENHTSRKVASLSAGTQIPYHLNPDLSNVPPLVSKILRSLTIPGLHNQENALAALTASACVFNLSLEDFAATHEKTLTQTFQNFHGLPHRLEFVRNLNGVDYYDDNYSSAFPSLDVALAAFADRPTILIAGGKDKKIDLSDIKHRIFSAKNLKKAILIGETSRLIAKNEDPARFTFADTLAEAVQKAQSLAEEIAENQNSNFDLCIPAISAPRAPVVLMSPACASFDMFQNFKDRGEQFQALVHDL